MEIIAHRGLWQNDLKPNTLAALELALSSKFGIETDVRSYHHELYVSHDPILAPEKCIPFSKVLELSEQNPASHFFINIKEDGLSELLAPYADRILKTKMIFFDMSVPELYKYSKIFPRRQLCTRFSQFEKYPSGAEFCTWLWVDCFTRDFTSTDLKNLVMDFPSMKLAFVSPELHGRDPHRFWNALSHLNMNSALCTDLATEFKGTKEVSRG